MRLLPHAFNAGACLKTLTISLHTHTEHKPGRILQGKFHYLIQSAESLCLQLIQFLDQITISCVELFRLSLFKLIPNMIWHTSHTETCSPYIFFWMEEFNMARQYICGERYDSSNCVYKIKQRHIRTITPREVLR